jgi:hypothetical protein
MANTQKQKEEKIIHHSNGESVLTKFSLAFEYDRTWTEARMSSRQSSKR